MTTTLRTVIKTGGGLFLFQRTASRRLLLFTKRVKLHLVKSLSSSSVFHCSDVTKLTSKDEENIVFTLNTLSKEELSKTGVVPPLLLEEMFTNRSERGPFLSLGDVLSLPGMDNEVFKNICNSFQHKRIQNTISLIHDPEYLKYFSPFLSPEIMENIQSVTSLEVCLESVCYASATRTQEVMEWNHIPLLGSNHGRQSPAQVLEQALHVIPHIPKADIYLTEIRIPRKISLQYMQILLFIARLQTAIQTLLSAQQLEQNGQHSFFVVKDLFVARMFDLRVGGERVSGQHVVQQIENGELLNQAVIDQKLWRQFHRLRQGVEKERYSNCLMMCLAFINYIGPEQPSTG